MNIHGLGALPTPPEILEKAWPIHWALAKAPVPVPPKFHSPLCRGTTVDQNGYGACETFSAAYVQAALEWADEGRDLVGILDPLRLYATLKGYPWPPSGKNWDSNPGLYSQQVWSYAVKTGFPTTDGSIARKDASYYNLGKPNSGAAFRDAYQQTLLQLGPVQFVMEWPNNWWNTDSQGYMPSPGPSDGAHAFKGCGWDTDANGLLIPICHQSWGPWGHDPEFPNHFRIKPAWLDGIGMEAWKVTDVIGDVPVLNFVDQGADVKTATLITTTRLIDQTGKYVLPEQYQTVRKGTIVWNRITEKCHTTVLADGRTVYLLDRNFTFA